MLYQLCTWLIRKCTGRSVCFFYHTSWVMFIQYLTAHKGINRHVRQRKLSCTHKICLLSDSFNVIDSEGYCICSKHLVFVSLTDPKGINAYRRKIIFRTDQLEYLGLIALHSVCQAALESPHWRLNKHCIPLRKFSLQEPMKHEASQDMWPF
jgi:hypothetical protein